MALFAQSDLEDAFPEATSLLAMDDDGDGVADSGVFTRLLAAATEFIEGYLQQCGGSIADPPQKRLKHIGLRYAEYTLWRRRGHTARADAVYEQWLKPEMVWLDRIANGKEALKPGATEDGAATAITEPAKTHLSGGGLMV